MLFADVTNIFAEGKNPQELAVRINKELEGLSRWFRCNKLTLNVKKTEYVYFKGPGRAPPLEVGIKIGEEHIKQVEGATFLGLWVDEGLKWEGQIRKVSSKVAQLLGVVSRAKTVLEGRTLLTLYNGLVLPHLQYCLTVWGDFREGRNVTLGAPLLGYQKRFANMVMGKRARSHADPSLTESGILKISDLYRQQLRVHAWQFWNGHLPTNQAAMFSKTTAVHSHRTRSTGTGPLPVY